MNTADGFVSTPNYQLILGGVIFTIVLLIIFNIRQLKNIITKATDLIANVINAVLTVFSSIADAVKSAAYYSLVIRMMLFPSFNKRTNNMVLRLTILFLSITSFITTYQSMSDALNETVALLLTFCIQSLIVVFSIHIGHGFEPFDAGRQKPQGSAGHTGDRNKKARKNHKYYSGRSFPCSLSRHIHLVFVELHCESNQGECGLLKK